jgi:hypothetical protein
MQSCQTILATNVNSYSENHPEIGSVGHKKAHECWASGRPLTSLKQKEKFLVTFTGDFEVEPP